MKYVILAVEFGTRISEETLDVTIDMKNNKMEVHKKSVEPGKIL